MSPSPTSGVSSLGGAPAAFRAASSLLTVLFCGAVVVLASARQPAEQAQQKLQPSPAGSTSAEAAEPAAPAPPLLATAAPASTVQTDADTAIASCTIPNRGAGPYGPWERLSLGKVLRPSQPPEQYYDVLLHFHGAEAIRKVVAPMGFDNLVIIALDAGEGSSRYSDAFYAARPLAKLLEEAGRPLRPARMRHLIVSSWSAGYGAVREILTFEPKAPDALVLLDSVHASYEDDGVRVQGEGVAPFLAFAKRARAAEVPMVLTHSDIRPPGYASTTEVADALLAGLEAQRRFAGLASHYGVETKSQFSDGLLQLRGYSGTNKPAHCAHLRMLADILRDSVLPALQRKSASTSDPAHDAITGDAPAAGSATAQ